MRQECRSLSTFIEEEKSMKKQYVIEVEKLTHNLIIARENLSNYKSDLANKDRELEDLTENHQTTLNIYLQKIKHLLF